MFVGSRASIESAVALDAHTYITIQQYDMYRFYGLNNNMSTGR